MTKRGEKKLLLTRRYQGYRAESDQGRKNLSNVDSNYPGGWKCQSDNSFVEGLVPQ